MNVHLGKCSGCNFHQFPYKAKPPVKNAELIQFNSIKDVKNVVKELINEVKFWNEKGKSFDIAQSIAKQLPFFCCSNSFLSHDLQKTISKYIYCQETGVQAYAGAYNEQPYRWVQEYFVIKEALAIKNSEIKNASS